MMIGKLLAMVPSKATVQEMKSVLNAVPMMACYVDSGLICKCVNDQYIDFFGPVLADGKPYVEVDGGAIDYAGILDGQRHVRSTQIVSGGDTHDLEIVYEPVTKNGKTTGFYVFHRDVTHRKDTERQLRNSEIRFQVIMDHLGESVIVTDTRGNIEFANRATERVFGYKVTEVQGKNVIVLIPERFREHHQRNMIEHSYKMLNIPREVHALHRNGTEFKAEILVTEAFFGDERKFITIIRDVTDRRETEERIHYIAHHDDLTGLPNRLQFRARLQTAIDMQDRHYKKIAVMFLDLDNFKDVNDSLGHDVGDKLLQMAARRLRETVRKSDLAARLGGDEFAVIAEVNTDDDAARLATKIIAEIKQPYVIDGNTVHTGTSIGITMYPDDIKTEDARDIQKAADLALYAAKDDGNGNYRFFVKKMNDEVQERKVIEEDLRRAIDNGDIGLAYQPKLNLRSNTIYAAEALARWVHPDRGYIPPNVFVDVAEKSGLIIPLGNLVLEKAFQQLHQWSNEGFHPSISVNISGAQFCHGDITTSVQKFLERYNIIPGLLELEITETVLMTDLHETLVTLDKLKKLGVFVSIDDFGSGYSSLSYLRSFAVDILKIDKSFIDHVPARTFDTDLLKSIITLAHGLRKQVVVEGVETAEQLRFLCGNHCDIAQGYFIARPMDATSFREFYLDYNERRPHLCGCKNCVAEGYTG